MKTDAFETMLKSKIAEALQSQADIQLTDALKAEIDLKVKDVLNSAEFKRKLPEEPEAKAGFKSFGDFLQAVRLSASDVQYKNELLTKAPSGLGEGTPSDGAFLVQGDFSAELIKRSHETGILSRLCRKIPISNVANRITINAVDEKSRANGARWGGIQVYWTNEADAVTASKPKFRQIELKLNKLTGAYYATEELLADTAALGQLVLEGFAEEFSFKIDDAIMNGTGGGQPLGILKSACRVTVPKETGQAAASLVYDNLRKMRTRMTPKNRMKAQFFINVDCEPELDGMTIAVGTGGLPVYLPPGGLSVEPYSRLFGKSIIPVEQCQALGTEGDILYADLSDYLLAEKQGLAAAESMHVRFLWGENTYRFTYRVDGQPMWNKPLSPFKGNTTTSPFVTLATRA